MSHRTDHTPSHRKVWSGLATGDARAEVGILGVPFDGATSYRKGAAFAPEAIRALTPHVGPFTEEGTSLAHLKVRDYGDVPADLEWERYFETVEQRAEEALRHPFAIFLGGDHSVTIPLVRAMSRMAGGRLGVVHFDAHLDLADEYDGHRWSHACTERRLLELPNIAPCDLACVAVRSWMEDEAKFVAAHSDIGVFTARQLHRKGAVVIADQVANQLQDVDAVYFTCDIDGLDPAFAPGTGVPEAGGPSMRELLEFLRVIFARLPVRAADFVEVAPPLDPSGTTVAAVVRLIYEVLGWVDQRAR